MHKLPVTKITVISATEMDDRLRARVEEVFGKKHPEGIRSARLSKPYPSTGELHNINESGRNTVAATVFSAVAAGLYREYKYLPLYKTDKPCPVCRIQGLLLSYSGFI